jgi:hypothetical protein
MAPAGTVELFHDNYRPLLKTPKSQTGINRMEIYNLTDKLELDDSVAGVYRKSLLYLVSRSFEDGELPAALLGMEKHKRGVATGLNNLKMLYSSGSETRKTRSESHGGFDNDPATMNSIVQRILGKKPAQPFTKKSLRY